MLHLIDNKPTIDFTSYVDIESLINLKPYLDYAVVKSSTLATPSRYYKSQFLDQTYQGINDIIKNDFTYDFIQDLKDHDQLASWLRYNQDVVYGQQSVPVIYPKDWNTKHLMSETVATDNKKYWTKFLEWVEAQDIFAGYGRVVVFFNEAGVDTPIHFDSGDATRRDEFIWISLDNRKKMFVYDLDTKQKHYMNTYIGTFDATNYHGAEVGNLACWSIRVDGIFSDNFLNRTGLYNHYRNKNL